MAEANKIMVQGERIEIYLDVEGAEWLLAHLPEGDGYTLEVTTAVEKLKKATELKGKKVTCDSPWGTGRVHYWHVDCVNPRLAS